MADNATTVTPESGQDAAVEFKPSTAALRLFGRDADLQVEGEPTPEVPPIEDGSDHEHEQPSGKPEDAPDTGLSHEEMFGTPQKGTEQKPDQVQQPASGTTPTPAQAPVAGQPQPQGVDPAQWQQFQAFLQAQRTGQIPVPGMQGQQHLAQPAQQQQQQQLPQLTDEQKQRFFQTARVTPEVYRGIFESDTPEESMQALENFGQAIVRNALTMANHLVAAEVNRVVEQVQPYMQFADSQRNLMMEQQFYGQNPDMRGMEVLVDESINRLSQQGYQFQNTNDLFNAIRNDVQQRLQILQGVIPANGQGQPTPVQQVAQQPQVTAGVQQMAPIQQAGPTGKPRMAALTSGSQGGTGTMSSGQQTQPGVNPLASKLFGH